MFDSMRRMAVRSRLFESTSYQTLLLTLERDGRQWVNVRRGSAYGRIVGDEQETRNMDSGCQYRLPIFSQSIREKVQANWKRPWGLEASLGIHVESALVRGRSLMPSDRNTRLDTRGQSRLDKRWTSHLTCSHHPHEVFTTLA